MYFFYLTGFLCLYSYFIYPLVLKLIPVRRQKVVNEKGDEGLPFLTLIITVHNESDRIEAKLENSLAINYPRDNFELIVASDFSADATDSIVESFAGRGVHLMRVDERKGKEYAQLCAIRESRGEILIFSDVSTMVPPDALLILVEEFVDRSVGALSSEDRFISSDGRLVGESAYVKYEMWLQRLESDRAGLVGLSGSFFAARREVCEKWDIYSDSDFNTALNCVKTGKVAISCPKVFGLYKDVMDPSLEYQRKIRTVIRGITAISRHPEAINPFRMGLFAFQVWSHKIMRWGVPSFMLLFLVSTLLLQGEGMTYSLALIAQLLFYSLALDGWLSSVLQRNTLVRIVFFFVQSNLALAQALLAFLDGKRMTIWTPTKR